MRINKQRIKNIANSYYEELYVKKGTTEIRVSKEE